MGHAAKEKRATGGKPKADRKTPTNVYNAVGAPEIGEATDEEPGFKHGGAPKRKHGGHAEGEAERKRLDKRARGGKLPEHKREMEHDRREHEAMPRRARGGATHSPYSSTHVNAKPHMDTGPGRGHEGVQTGDTSMEPD